MSILKKINCDVLIVGAGPAGASLAYYLSSLNLRAVLVERKNQPDIPVRCAELVPKNLFSLFKDKIDGINCEISRMMTFVNGVFKNEILSPSYMLDRQSFVSSLIEKFKENGGLFLNSMSFTDIKSLHTGKKEIDKNEVKSGVQDFYYNSINSILFGNIDKHELSIKSKIIVGADGTISRVRKKIKEMFDINGKQNPEFMLAFQETISKQKPYKDYSLVFFYPYITNGYGWVFPKSNTINIGIGSVPATDSLNDSDLREKYEKFKNDIKSLGFISGKEKTLKRISGMAPCSGIQHPCSISNFVFAGDAAGLCNPVTGAGIYNAVLSSGIISEHIFDFFKSGDFNRLNDIDSVFDDYFRISMERALEKRRQINSGWNSSDFDSLIKNTWVSFKDYWEK